MDKKIIVDMSKCSLEELVKLQTKLNNLIERKKEQVYETAVGKVLESLKEMAEKYPFDDAFDYGEGYVTWRELYEAIYNF